MNNIDVLNAYHACSVLSNEKLNGSLSMAVRKLYRELQAIIEDQEDERKKLVKLYGKKSENEQPLTETLRDNEGNPILNADGSPQQKFILEDEDSFNKDYQELMKANVTVNNIIRENLITSNDVIEPSTLIMLGDCLEE